MISKNKLRGKLKSTPYSHENYSGIVLKEINNLITNKTVCTYIPLPSEIRFNEYLLNSKLLTTSSCLLYTSPSPRYYKRSRMTSSA